LGWEGQREEEKKTSERKILYFFTELNLCGKETGKWSMSYLL